MQKIIRINEITEEDLQKFREIDKRCMEMHVCPPPRTFVNMKVKMPNGVEVLDYSFRSKSWVRNMYNFMLGKAFGAGNNDATYGAGLTSIKETNATIESIATLWTSAMTPNTTTSGGNVGIVVGTGTAAESFEDYILGAKVAHGTGSGQLSYVDQASITGTLAYTAGTKTWAVDIVRILNNNSGGTITIGETGIYYYASSGTKIAMMCRDKLASAVDVVDTAQLTVTYTMEMVFSG